MTEKSQLISVIIPAFNVAESIERSVASIADQDAINYIGEVIIVNDGSTDNTAEVVSRLASLYKDLNIRLLSQSNKGVSAARNAGIQNSNHPWIALLDADDAWTANKISKSLEILKKYPQIQALGTNRNKELVKHGKKVAPRLYELSVKHQLIKYWPSTPSLVINKKVFDKTGLFNEEQRYAEDGNLFIRISHEFKIHYIFDSLLKTANKPTYGFSGLSGNLKEMHKGSIENIKDSRKWGYINGFEYCIFFSLEKLKYTKRIILTYIRKLNH